MVARKIPVLFCVVLFSTPVLADGFKLVSRDGRQAEYEGSLSLSGRFERRQDAETLDWRGDRVCFFPDAQAAGQLPGGKSGGMFCFSNSRAAMQQFSLASASQPPGSCGVTGVATVAISHYMAETGVGETIDQAWLEKVEQQGPVAPIRCN